MIKIESVEGICTITRDGHDCVLFVGMQITPEEVETMVAGGDVVYSIDESQIVVVAKGEKATVSEVVKTEVEAAPTTETAPTEETKEEQAPEEVVPPSVEVTAQVAAPAKK